MKDCHKLWGLVFVPPHCPCILYVQGYKKRIINTREILWKRLKVPKVLKVIKVLKALTRNYHFRCSATFWRREPWPYPIQRSIIVPSGEMRV